MFENILKFFKKFSKEKNADSKDTAKERLHLVLMQDRANVSADFLELMKQEIIEVIKKYVDVDENLIDVKLTNKMNNDGTTGAPALYANIPIVSIKDETRKINVEKPEDKKEKLEEKQETKQEENKLEEKTVENEDKKNEEEVEEGKNKEESNNETLEEVAKEQEVEKTETENVKS